MRAGGGGEGVAAQAREQGQPFSFLKLSFMGDALGSLHTVLDHGAVHESNFHGQEDGTEEGEEEEREPELASEAGKVHPRVGWSRSGMMKSTLDDGTVTLRSSRMDGMKRKQRIRSGIRFRKCGDPVPRASGAWMSRNESI